MATILMTWELGGGLGHVTVLRPVADALIERGHRVVLATRDVGAAEKVFHGTRVTFVQAPIKQSRIKRPFVPQRSFAHVLHHAGFEDEAELSALVHAWQGLFELVCPELVVFDHSPTALLASRGRSMKRVLIGTGFCAPPVGECLPDMRPWLPDDSAKLRADEANTLAVANSVLRSNGLPLLDRMADLYGCADENLLTTYEELDHFGPRKLVRYWGTHPACPGTSPKWPRGTGKRIFAYLKRDRGLRETVRILGEFGQPTIAYGDWVSDEVRRRLSFPNLHLASSPLDLTQVTASCDIAVLNATHGTTAEFLLAGKPVLQLPIYLEQRLVAERTRMLRAGCIANRGDAADIELKLNRMLRDDQFSVAAVEFSKRYSLRNRGADFQDMIERVEQLAM